MNSKPTARPILFSGEMVRALLAGRKTQTRRVVKGSGLTDTNGETRFRAPCSGLYYKHPGAAGFDCPYGKPGDLLWVRETFGYGCRPDPIHGAVDGIEYRADEAHLEGPDLLPLYTPETPESFCYGDVIGGGWRPSIHMPRWASRLTLRVTGVRAERLQDIANGDNGLCRINDIEAEGLDQIFDGQDDRVDSDGAINWFQNLWDAINGPGSWEKNPWVWVVEFDVIEKNVNDVIEAES